MLYLSLQCTTVEEEKGLQCLQLYSVLSRFTIKTSSQCIGGGGEERFLLLTVYTAYMQCIGEEEKVF